MSNLAYGTFTITNLSAVTSVDVYYYNSTSSTSLSGGSWSTDTPTWTDGKYIWSKTVTTWEQGVTTQSEPVCITGQKGSTGATGQSVTKITQQYALGSNSTTAPTTGWSTTMPTFESGKFYWTRSEIIWANPTSTTYTTAVLANGITSANTTAAVANTNAQRAVTTANSASSKADNAISTANTANQTAQNAVSVANGKNTIYYSSSKPTGGTYRAGDTWFFLTDDGYRIYEYDTTSGDWVQKSMDGKSITAGTVTAAQIQAGAITTNKLATDAIKSTNYVAGTVPFSNRGTFLDLSNGNMYSPVFGVNATENNQGAFIKGSVQAYDGRIGQNQLNYWYIGNYYDYNQLKSAYIKGNGTATIQLGDTSTWRLNTNRIHTAWNENKQGGDDYKLHYPVYDSKYWDMGLHVPTSATDKFIYIRKSKSSSSIVSLTNLQNSINDQVDGTNKYWNYQFYVTSEGNLYAKNLYILDDNGGTTQIAGTSAPYLLKSGGDISGNLTIGGTLKISNNILNKSGNAITLQTSLTSTTAATLTGNSTSPISIGVTGTLSTSNGGTGNTSYNTGGVVYVDNSSPKKLLSTAAGTSGYLLKSGGTGAPSWVNPGTLTVAAATKATQDGDGNVIKTTYLKLTGGNITGPVDFGDSVTIDDLNTGTLTVTNNIQANTINNIEVGSNPKFTDTVTTITTEGNGNAITSIEATKGALKAIKGATFLMGITSQNVINALGYTPYNATTNPNGYTTNTGTVTSVQVQASSPLQSSINSIQNSSLSTTISFINQNANVVLAGPSSGNAAAPAFRALVAADIPSLTKSKISDFPTSLKNPNNLSIKIFNGSSTATTTTYDGSVSNQSINVAGINAITNINSTTDGKLQLTLADGSKPDPISIKITATTSDSSSMANKLNLSQNVGSTSKPVYFDANTGLPKEINYTIQSNVPQNAVFTDTKYSAGTGLSLSGTTFSNSGVTGVKGSNESSYRTGQVNLTPANIGAFESLSYQRGTTEVGIRPLVDQTRANRLAFLPADQIIIEKTTDGGTTWEDAGISDSQKCSLFVNGTSIPIPLLNGEKSTQCGIRITITAMKYNVPQNTSETQKYNYWNSTYVKSQERYFNVREWWFWISANRDTIKPEIYCSTGANPNNWSTIFNKDFGMTGWSGSDWIRAGDGKTFGGGITQTGNYWNWRLIFWSKFADGKTVFNSTTTQTISTIKCYGDSVWNGSNGLATRDHLYSWDNNKNATFPAQITATQFNGKLNGNAATATTAEVLTNKVLDSLTLNSTTGTFSFQGNGIPWDGTDWVGLQVGSDNDKFQIHALNGTTLEYRQNSSGGTNSNWGDWYALLSSGNYTDYTVTKTGTGASGTWNISVTGTSTNVTGTVTVEHGGTGATSFTSGALLIGNGTGAIGTRTIKNMTTKGNLGWTASGTDIYIPTVNTITFWDGRYNSSSSNLTYCVKGAFGDAAVKGVVTTLDTSVNLPTAGAISTALGNYVTLTTEQTISGHKTFSNLITFKDNTGSEYCNINYNQTLGALVFSFG